MQRKNWVIPGILVLMLLLLSFPVFAQAEETVAEGGEIPADEAVVSTTPDTSLPLTEQPAPEPTAVPEETTPPTEESKVEENSASQAPVPEETVPAEEGTIEEDSTVPAPVPEETAPAEEGGVAEDSVAPVPVSEGTAPVEKGRAEEDSTAPAPVPEETVSAEEGRLQKDCVVPVPVDEVTTPAEENRVEDNSAAPAFVYEETAPAAEGGVEEDNTAPAPAPNKTAPADEGWKEQGKAPGGDLSVSAPQDKVNKETVSKPVKQSRGHNIGGTPAPRKDKGAPAAAAASVTGLQADSAEQGHSVNDLVAYIIYKVRKGESLWLIGKNLGVYYREIMKANNIKDHLIYPDQELKIPGVKMENGVIIFRVKPGDTFYFIAKALGLNYEDIMSLNGKTDIWIYPDEELKIQMSPGDSDPESVLVADDALELLARAIYAEARGEIFEGQIAVGAVILNRLKAEGFPKTIRDIIYQPGAFTAVDDGQINLTPDATAYKAARIAMAGADPSMGALYYWNPDLATSEWIWTRPIIKQIGNHVFAR